MMSALNIFKELLVRELLIVEWKPSEQDLRTIARKVVEVRANTLADYECIVSEVCPGTLFLTTEGLDNSDLRTLLTLAAAAAAADQG